MVDGAAPWEGWEMPSVDWELPLSSVSLPPGLAIGFLRGVVKMSPETLRRSLRKANRNTGYGKPKASKSYAYHPDDRQGIWNVGGYCHDVPSPEPLRLNYWTSSHIMKTRQWINSGERHASERWSLVSFIFDFVLDLYGEDLNQPRADHTRAGGAQQQSDYTEA